MVTHQLEQQRQNNLGTSEKKSLVDMSTYPTLFHHYLIRQTDYYGGFFPKELKGLILVQVL